VKFTLGQLEPPANYSHPLLKGDADVLLDLQQVFNTVYDRAGYDYSLDYNREVEPPLSEEDTRWVKERLSAFFATKR